MQYNYPEALQEKIFKKLFGEAEIAGLAPDELEAYDESLKTYRDMKGCVDTAHREGYQEAVNEMNSKVEQAEAAKKAEQERATKAEVEKQKMIALLKSMGLSDYEIQDKLNDM